MDSGVEIFAFLSKIWPYCRSITGNGLRKTLYDIRNEIKNLEIIEVPSGTKVLDWTIPPEWNVNSAWVRTLSGKKVIDFEDNNLHLLGYSIPYKGIVSRNELLEHLYTLPEQPDWIPYVTSYYKERWGFCISHKDLDLLVDDYYEVMIDSELKPGSLTYGEVKIPGESSEEILCSTYCCHPSMANDQLSGIGLSVALAKYLQHRKHNRYTYKFIFIPEIIGSAAYLQKELPDIKYRVKAAFNLTCCGDNRSWSYLPTRFGNTYADKVALNALTFSGQPFRSYSWNNRGSDESMFCAPGLDIPMVSIMRTKYGEFAEYHTSGDQLGITVTEDGLETTFQFYKKLFEAIEHDCKPLVSVLGEPQLGPRGLYPDLSIKGSTNIVKDMLNVLSYCDGNNDLFDISNLAQVPTDRVINILAILKSNGLITV
jgi:aminopeptidase-like protein